MALAEVVNGCGLLIDAAFDGFDGLLFWSTDFERQVPIVDRNVEAGTRL